MKEEPYKIIEKQIEGIKVTVSFYPDLGMGPPWDEHDGHGEVSDWKPRSRKKAGERELGGDRGMYRYYDFSGAVKLAKKEGWGLPPEILSKLELEKGRHLTRGEIAHAAAENDFNFLRRWLNNDWIWVFAIAEAEGLPDSDALGGIDSDSMEYFAQEMAEGIVAGIKKESALAHEAACRDIATVAA